MRYSTLFSVALTSLTLPFFSSAEHLGHSARRHNELASRKRGDLLETRSGSARGTFFDVGLGACGKWSQPGDFMVALSSVNFGSGYPGPECFKWITITYQGKSAQAQILDECPGCPDRGLDMSRGLFTHFAPESVGVIYMDWSYDDGGGAPPPPKPAPPKPSTTWKPPAPTSSWSAPAWTTHTPSQSKTSSAWSSSSTGYSALNSTVHSGTLAGAGTSSAEPSVTPTSIVAEPQNLQSLSDVVVQLGQIVLHSGL